MHNTYTQHESQLLQNIKNEILKNQYQTLQNPKDFAPSYAPKLLRLKALRKRTNEHVSTSPREIGNQIINDPYAKDNESGEGTSPATKAWKNGILQESDQEKFSDLSEDDINDEEDEVLMQKNIAQLVVDHQLQQAS